MNNTLSNPNASHQSHNANSDWDDLSKVPFTANSQPEDPDSQTVFFNTRDPKRPNRLPQDHNKLYERLQRQGAKIVNALHTGKSVVEVSDSATEADRQDFYNWFINGQLSPAIESQLLQTIRPPMFGKEENAEKTLKALSSVHEQRILAVASGRGFNNYDSVDLTDLATAIQNYPTPVEFQSLEASLINSIQQPAKRTAYTEDLEVFKQKFYGKRQEYHEAWQNLEREARNQQLLTAPNRETPEEYAQNVADGVYAEYFDPAERERVYRPDFNTNQALDGSAHQPNSGKPEAKKGLFGKFFGRKK